MSDTVTHTCHVPDCAPIILPAGSPDARQVRPLNPALPRLGADEVELARLIRRGRFIMLPSLQAILSLHFEPSATFVNTDVLTLSGPYGAIEIAQGGRLIQGLTGIHPEFLPVGGSAQCEWFEAALAGRLAATPFGRATIDPSTTAAAGEGLFCLQLTLRSSRHLLRTQARAALSTWTEFLAAADWEQERLPASHYAGLKAESTVQIASHTLPAGAVRRLAVGDVIVPDSPIFAPDGTGQIQLGGRDVHVRYCGPSSLEIIAGG